MTWNFGDILDALPKALPADAPAFIHGDRTITWGETSRRSNNLARAILARSAKPGDKVAFYMRNRPEYGEALAACFKGRLTHVNVNYRYKPDEVFYIFDDSDAHTVIYGSEFRDTVLQLKDRLPKVATFIEIGDDDPLAPFSERYEDLASTGEGAPLGIERSPDDLLFIYTGGTTGMPKGVMWRHEDLREAQLDAVRRLGPAPETLEAHLDFVRAAGPGSRTLPACPMMHGTGLITAIGCMMNGGCVVTLQNASFEADELWSVVARHRVQSIALVGDAFAKPMLKALDEQPGRYDTSSLISVVSSGVMWSREVKAGLLGHIPQVVLMDSFGASEALGFGSSAMTKDGEVRTATFQIGPRCKVFDEEENLVEPGSGKAGIIAIGGPIPLGYYKDPEKTAKTFRTIAGQRYSIPGDWCTVEADGAMTLLGRGSACINTAGEKVYPEEVEEALKTHPDIEDALVVGVPDDKWGQAVTGVVVLASGVTFDEDDVRRHVRASLAGYKTPKRILLTQVPLRASNGKADYKTVTEFARRDLGLA
ncbi:MULTISPECIES: acyl-CoA synthetase [unclassified Phenylobacterium]|jgi:fatty-acyl-CoA synthase|uniref:acyl-CoA synthetase n=1 Tax=unclassified Phenylobacterium TaxID=2640670 RepID=UPI000839D9FC|nr:MULTISPECIES: acyl-CoA synthetase [unclassified Phenylobacterium]